MWLYITCLFFRVVTSRMKVRGYRIYYQTLVDASNWHREFGLRESLGEALDFCSRDMERYNIKRMRVVPVFRMFDEIHPEHWQKIPFEWNMFRPKKLTLDDAMRMVTFILCIMIILLTMMGCIWALKTLVTYLHSR